MVKREAGGVWLRPERPVREAPMTRERIVAEAVALLDAEGVAGLTMRRLAERLGTGSTTLYWHVTTKDDVLDLALDAVFGEARLPSADAGGWRARARALMGEWRAAMLRHPWTSALLGRPLMGPNVLERTEYLHATLAGAGLTGPALTAAAYGLSHFVIGSAMMEAAWQSSGQSTDEGAGAADAAIAGHLRERAERYPVLAGQGHPAATDWDASFERGLGYLLDGIAAALPTPPDAR
ncbi:TetR/AcrR family transcriptional regulator [Spongiactinospora sp. 9N601]|uniref:TetR/AcrR family transcriptional regulator n=1 Tax=Spongiactinospora sp. 9N601 TaxID=3375149 RepID=UPI00378D7397